MANTHLLLDFFGVLEAVVSCDSVSGIGLKGEVANLWAVVTAVTSEPLALGPGSSTLITRADLALNAPDGGLKYAHINYSTW